MTKSLSDILSNRSNSQPKEITILKEYVLTTFNKEIKVTVGDDKIKIATSNSALAGELRLRIYEIQKLLETKKKIIILIN